MHRRRRTRFATPVIVTVAACSSSKEPPKPLGFPGATWSVRMLVDMRCVASQRNRNDPPRSIDCPPGMSGTTVFTVGELSNKTCGIVPPGCVEERCVTIPASCPLPPGVEAVQNLAVVWTIEKRGDDCHAEEGEGHDECPQGIDCNPPEPRIVKCPPGVTDTQSIRIAELVDATCVVVPDGCETTGCAKQKIGCPVP